MLIAIPHGLCVSGVAVWAVRLADALVRRGCGAGLILHPEPAGHSRLDAPLHPDVRIWRLPDDTQPLEQAAGDLSTYLPVYRQAVREMAERASSPVVLCPNLHGDCYGIAAALTQAMPDIVRIIGWHHSDITYNNRILTHYEPIIARFAAVSDEIERKLATFIPDRIGDIANIPYGVPVAQKVPKRPSLTGRPIRLIYTGRMEHEQKRIMSLVALAEELERRGIAYELTLVGDGPAAPEIDQRIAPLKAVHRIGAASPQKVAALLQEHDAFVLGSRYEGLSVSMLEAMAAGCVPIVTRVQSGATQALKHGVSGLLAEAGPDATKEQAGTALADAVGSFLAGNPEAMAAAAWEVASQKYSMERHTDAVCRLIDAAAHSPARIWPQDKPCAFSAKAADGSSGSVPAGGAERMKAILASLAGRKVVIHGTGEHTRQLMDVIEASPAIVVAFTDDDANLHGTVFAGRPIISPQEAKAAGATDVVISSWMHEEAIWARRDVYETHGLRVHLIYGQESKTHPATI